MNFFGKRDDEIHLPQSDIETLVRGAREALGGQLKSVLIFGSSASDEFHKERSDMNVLMVVESLAMETLKKMTIFLKEWSKRESAIPVLIDKKELALYARTLPIEFLDIQQHHRIVFGENPLKDLHISTTNLRAQCEQELSVKLLKLRQETASHIQDEAYMRKLLVESISSILTLFRAVLRLEEEVPPMSKLKAGQKVVEKMGLDTEDLRRIYDLRFRRSQDPIEHLTGRYLSMVEKVLHRMSNSK